MSCFVDFNNKCKVGDMVKMRCGGDFYLDFNEADKRKHFLLVAGGVGINPICSIIRDLAENITKSQSNEHQVILLYSGKTEKDLLFKVRSNTCDKNSEIYSIN